MRKIILIIPAVLAIPILAGCGTVAGAAPLPTTGPDPTATPAAPAWKVVHTIAYTQSVYYAGFLNADYGITVGYSGEVHYTNDGGATWPQAVNTSWCRFGLEIVDENVAWHCGNGGHVRLSTDGGKTWQAAANFGPNEPDQCRFLSFLDATTGWAGTDTLLALTTDGGQTWTPIPLPAGVDRISALDLRTAAQGYLLAANGTLYVTSDAGASWTPMPLDFASDAFLLKTPAPSAAVRFADENNGVIALSRRNQDGVRVWTASTADGGKSWTVEQVPAGSGSQNLFLSRDGKTLTVLSQIERTITVLQQQ